MIGDIRKFRFWCQKVLPLVYDNSLSYYELLCKVVDYLNKVIEDVNSIPEYIDSVIDERLDDDHLKELIEQLVIEFKHTITDNDDGDSATATQNWTTGQWLWLNDILYIVTKDITEGNAYVFTGDNANVKTITVENEQETIYYPNDKKLSLHGKISDYTQITTLGDVHTYNPTTSAITIEHLDD